MHVMESQTVYYTLEDTAVLPHTSRIELSTGKLVPQAPGSRRLNRLRRKAYMPYVYSGIRVAVLISIIIRMKRVPLLRGFDV